MPIYEQGHITPNEKPLLKLALLELIFEIGHELQSIIGTRKRDVFQAMSNRGIICHAQIVPQKLRQTTSVNLFLGATNKRDVDIGRLVVARDSAKRTP